MQHEIDLFFQFFFYTSVAQTTDVNMLLWRHQPVLHHNDWLRISWSHCHGFVDKLSTSSSTRSLKRLWRCRNLRPRSCVDSFVFSLVSLPHEIDHNFIGRSIYKLMAFCLCLCHRYKTSICHKHCTSTRSKFDPFDPKFTLLVAINSIKKYI